MQHYKEIKTHPEPISNIQPFIDFFNWDGIKYPTVMNDNNYAVFERKKYGNCFNCAIC